MININEENYRDFYVGTGAEYYFISKFYMLGYEAQKLHPDIGYDLLVTNKAKSVFENVSFDNYYIQVKSSILVKPDTSFWIKTDDFNRLLGDSNAFTVLAVYKPVFNVDPKSLTADYSDTPFAESLEVEWMEQMLGEYHDLKNRGGHKQFKFFDFTFEYIWLNSNHLKRLKSCDLIRSQEGYEKIYVRVPDESGFEILDKDNLPYGGGVVPEVHGLYYLVNNCWSKNRLMEGKLFWDDYETY